VVGAVGFGSNNNGAHFFFGRMSLIFTSTGSTFWAKLGQTFRVRHPPGFTYPPSILVKTLVDLLDPSTPANTLNMVVYSFYIFDRHSASQSPSPLQFQSLTTLKPSASIPGDGLRDLYPRAVKARGRSPAPALPAMATIFPQPAKLCQKKTMPS
jgi:hypothetical protein